MSMSKITIKEQAKSRVFHPERDAFIQKIGYLPNDLAAGTVAFV